MIAGWIGGDLGYDLGYLRHGSFGRATRDGPAGRAAWPNVRWRGLPAVAPGALYGLPAARAEAGRLRERMITLLSRWWWCRGARSVARRVLCAAPDAALRVPCVVRVAAPLARFAVPDAARYQTSSYLWAWLASW